MPTLFVEWVDSVVFLLRCLLLSLFTYHLVHSRDSQELKIKPMEFAKAYMGDQSLPVNDLLKEHQSDEGAALEVRLAVPNEILYDSVRSIAALSSDTVYFTPGREKNMPPQTVLTYLLPLMDHLKPSKGVVQNEYVWHPLSRLGTSTAIAN
ncbi:hypothetical protein AFLA70_17g005791 [Aspergillus flavus AF70]|nr:hypothetical protein AFLA70_17g005791 [Aspergillus flavus AF70]